MISESFGRIIKNQSSKISESRKKTLDNISSALREVIIKDGHAVVQFICTHNSRRSQAAEFLMDTLSRAHKLPVIAYSAGTEFTAFYPTMIKALNTYGFKFLKYGFEPNPLYIYRVNNEDYFYYSKTYTDNLIKSDQKVIITVCSDADKNCPVIPGSYKRLHLGYEDPKHSDGSPEELQTYEAKVVEIASELLYLTKTLSDSLPDSDEE